MYTFMFLFLMNLEEQRHVIVNSTMVDLAAYFVLMREWPLEEIHAVGRE
jgi:hypothetical protein